MDSEAQVNPEAKQPPAWLVSIGRFFKTAWKNVIWPNLKSLFLQIWEAAGRSIVGKDPNVTKPTPATPPAPWGQSNSTAARESSMYKIASADPGVKLVATKNATRLRKVQDQVLTTILGQTGSCSLAQLYTFAGLTSEPADVDVGWTSTEGFNIKWSGDHWYLEVPQIEKL